MRLFKAFLRISHRRLTVSSERVCTTGTDASEHSLGKSPSKRALIQLKRYWLSLAWPQEHFLKSFQFP